MISKEMREYNVAIDEDGEVRHPDDLGIAEDVPLTDDERHEAALAAYEAEQAAIATVRNKEDFSTRNAYLRGVKRAVGDMNRHNGAAIQLASGHYVPRYPSVERAELLEADALFAARSLGQKACETCPLVQYCPIAEQTDELIRQLKDARTRTRFGKRMESLENNRFCETNMKPGRLDKDEA